MKLKERYRLNKASKVGETLICPSCNSSFIKTNYQQAFCKMQGGTICKDKYWNTVTPEKCCNTTRISPANNAWVVREQDENLYGVYRGRHTSEGYRIYGETACDEFGDPIYTVDSCGEWLHPHDGDNF